MNSIITVLIFFLFISLTVSKNLSEIGFCSEKMGNVRLKLFHGYEECINKNADTNGEEAKAKKCTAQYKLVGEPGKETDKKNCEENDKVSEKWFECIKPYKPMLKNNTNLVGCIKERIKDLIKNVIDHGLDADFKLPTLPFPNMGSS
ncbi:uncharacterized protein LOC141850486 [Brevipalpus obovatus]|uniref:uncharacterized protein LOC141850486 n=1 Tax=Brevipalpus obovatus TaxID=246614 RepID=UPI003D9F8E16